MKQQCNFQRFLHIESIHCILFAGVLLSLVLIGCATKEIETSNMSSEPAVEILLTPAETTTSGEPVALQIIGFDADGIQTNVYATPEFTLTGLTGTMDSHKFEPDPAAGAHAGTVTAKSGELSATSRIRVIPSLPWTEDFENVTLEKIPTHWIGATNKFFVRESDKARSGSNVLVKTPVTRGLNRSNVYIGPSNMKDYQIQIDLMGTKDRRRLPDMGLIANRYTLDMQGRHQRLQIRSWASDLRMAETIDFAWETDVWYTMRMKVETVEDKALIYGKVWKTADTEPDEWTITAEDPLPNREGSPGIYGYSPTIIYYDNLKVW